ncbi:uncharacterized protein PV07_07833 [Cladophialophora immunda]|uniref:Major facilitator superfamily (MFS) profile domain-containing protein n=1 Tax=Cladophialophora immunda TaxID=569365 RepID=A0A0D1ZJI6_9EURO|nr:uncharacterized protein PV07_07833 [Cladophialophora immunda]KIW28151.1 hypothetical protein PV07_07833 [Cladophialophora immunda]
MSKSTETETVINPQLRYEPETRNHDELEPPPDGGYGWVCLACCFAINCFTWGSVASYGVFLSYYLTVDAFPESRPLDYAFIGSFNFGVAMLAAPLVTRIARSFGIKLPMLAGAVIFGGGFIAASFATRIWHLYLSQGALVGLGVGFVYVPSIAVLSQWFARRRSLANGISAAGSGIGGLIFSFAIGAMIEHLGIGWALRITGIIALFANLVAAAFIRDRNSVIRPKQHPFDRDLVSRVEVLLLLSWAFLSMLGYIALLYSLSDFSLFIGLSRQQATQVTAFLNMGTALGRPFIGVASDRFGRFGVATSLTFVCGLSCLVIWIPATSFGVTVFFGILSGGILGVFWMTIGPLCVEVAGLKQLPSLLSLSWLSTVLPTTFSEVIALYLRRPGHARPYLYTQIFCGVSYICASFCLWGVRVLCRRPGGPAGRRKEERTGRPVSIGLAETSTTG